MFLGILFVSVTDGGGCYREEELSEERRHAFHLLTRQRASFSGVERH